MRVTVLVLAPLLLAQSALAQESCEVKSQFNSIPAAQPFSKRLNVAMATA